MTNISFQAEAVGREKRRNEWLNIRSRNISACRYKIQQIATKAALNRSLFGC